MATISGTGLYRGLIVCCLLLLGGFEALWLRQVWREQYEGLKQETEYVFQRTVGALQDSLVRRSMARNNACPDTTLLPHIPLPWAMNAPPPVLPPGKPVRLETQSQLVVRVQQPAGRKQPADTLHFNQLRVFIATSDSLTTSSKGIDRLLVNLPEKRFHHLMDGEQLIRIEQDTLPTVELEHAYRKNLHDAGLDLPFRLIQADTPPPAQGEGIFTQPAFAGLLTQRFYTAHFPEYQGYLMHRIWPSAAFALFVFGLTTAAFVLIFRSLRQQQRLSRLKNELISNITHELKTPITTVGVALEALSDFQALQNPEKTREYLALSKLELDRLALLVDKVLRLSMFEEQEPRLQPAPVDLAALVRQVVAAMTLQAERAGARIRTNIPADADFTVQADRLHLASVVFNLLDNALKYRSETPQIVLTLSKSAGSVFLTVRDNGIGIAPEYQSRIFDKFFRVPAGDRHDVKGHGLGLSYAAQVIRQHGGNITVDSSPGVGSVFTVSLPA